MPATDTDTTTAPAFTSLGINLASAGLGARALAATDEFFAPADRMLMDSPAVFAPDTYDDHGKWMDGWETRRRRDGGHDHVVIRLAAAGRIFGLDVDTSHFTGNHPPTVRIEGCLIEGDGAESDPGEETAWREILPRSPLGPDSHHFFAAANSGVCSHLRVHIYPDGGLARLRVWGQPRIDPAATGEIDLAAALNGGRVVACSDAHYGNYRRIVAPGRGENMGDGWETRRRRGPGNDWLIVGLAARGTIRRAQVDTAFFRGNFPDCCSLQGADFPDFSGNFADTDDTRISWQTLLGEQKLKPDAVHDYESELADIGPVTHVRLNIFPDGGISRLRLFGTIA